MVLFYELFVLGNLSVQLRAIRSNTMQIIKRRKKKNVEDDTCRLSNFLSFSGFHGTFGVCHNLVSGYIFFFLRFIFFCSQLTVDDNAGGGNKR